MSDSYSFLQPSDNLGRHNPAAFVFSQMLARVRSMTLGQVMSVTNTGTDIPAGTVSVQPMVSMADGMGNATPHGTINNVPYFRLQGGANAIIIDPVVGDIGILGICDRNISAVKATQSAGPPPTMRQFNFADALYLGGILGIVPPTQFVRFIEGGGIEFQDSLGNSMVTGIGFVNFITPVLQVNGIPITVP